MAPFEEIEVRANLLQQDALIGLEIPRQRLAELRELRPHTPASEVGHHGDILPAFRGVSVHDGWAGYRAYQACRHARCNVHHLRELTFLEEEYQQAWAGELKALLPAMRSAADRARAEGHRRLPAEQREPLLRRYRDLLAVGLAANPPPTGGRRPGQRGRPRAVAGA
jgi:hypothetical protein